MTQNRYTIQVFFADIAMLIFHQTPLLIFGVSLGNIRFFGRGSDRKVGFSEVRFLRNVTGNFGLGYSKRETDNPEKSH